MTDTSLSQRLRERVTKSTNWIDADALAKAADALEQHAAALNNCADTIEHLRQRESEQAAEIAALRQREGELRETCKCVRVFVQDCLDNSHDRSCIGNLMAARDTIDAALSGTVIGGEPVPQNGDGIVADTR